MLVLLLRNLEFWCYLENWNIFYYHGICKLTWLDWTFFNFRYWITIHRNIIYYVTNRSILSIVFKQTLNTIDDLREYYECSKGKFETNIIYIYIQTWTWKLFVLSFLIASYILTFFIIFLIRFTVYILSLFSNVPSMSRRFTVNYHSPTIITLFRVLDTIYILIIA